MAPRFPESRPYPSQRPPVPESVGPARDSAAAVRRSDPFRAEVVPLLQPGSFVRLRDHPDDLPPFQLIQCHGGRCWVRQQAWGGLVQWEVARRRLTRVA